MDENEKRCVADWLAALASFYLVAFTRWDVPRAPSLELSVLPSGGGQLFPKAKTMPRKARPNGAEGSRTPDLCSAIAALSQLSYSPFYTGSAPIVPIV